MVHIAGLAHKSPKTTSSVVDPFHIVNTQATLNLAKLLSEKGLKRFIYMSSIAVNGKYTGEPFTENSEVSPATEYAKSKYLLKKDLKRFLRKWDLSLS